MGLIFIYNLIYVKKFSRLYLRNLVNRNKLDHNIPIGLDYLKKQHLLFSLVILILFYTIVNYMIGQ